MLCYEETYKESDNFFSNFIVKDNTQLKDEFEKYTVHNEME